MGLLALVVLCAAASLPERLAQIRADRAAGRIGADETVAVRLEPGVCRIGGTLRLGPEDSHLRFIGAPGGGTWVSAGRELPQFEAVSRNLWRVKVPGGLAFDQLWVDGRRAQRAKTPNSGFHYIRRQLHEEEMNPVTHEVESLLKLGFLAHPEDLAPLDGLPQEELTNVVVRVYVSYETSVGRVARVDCARGRLVTESGCPGWHLWAWNPHHPVQLRYELENVRTALDAPGEWFHDMAKGELLYVPRPGEDIAKARAEVPVAESILSVEGTEGRPVRDVTFEDIGFCCSGHAIPRRFNPGQSSAGLVSAAVAVSGAEGVTFRRCRVAHTAQTGLWFMRNCRDCMVEASDFTDLGAGGVYIGPADRVPDMELPACDIPERIAVMGCKVSEGGRLYPEAAGINLFRGRDCRIERNEVNGFSWSGICMGWTWKCDAPTQVARNAIVSNAVSGIGRGLFSDLGGIYTLGDCGGSTVAFNRIDDVSSYDHTGYGSYGIYTDSGSAVIAFVSNTVMRAKDGAGFIHWGRRLTFVGNDFLFTAPDSRPIPSRPYNPKPPLRERVTRFATGFEGERPGRAPKDLLGISGADGDPADFGVARVVTDARRARHGRRMLVMEDAPGLKAAYHPNFTLPCGGARGPFTLRFSLRPADARARFRFDLRDKVHRPPDSAYSIGAMLKLEGGRLTMAGRTLAETPPESWTDVTLTVDFAGRRIVAKAVPAIGGAPVEVSAPFVSPLFAQVDTFEAMAPGEERCAIAIDDLSFDAS